MHNISQFGLAIGFKSTIFIVLLFEMNVPPVETALEMNQAGNDHYPVIKERNSLLILIITCFLFHD